MARKVIWSPGAVEELEQIGEFISQDSGFYGVAVVEKIFSVGENLGDLPLSGRMVPEVNQSNLREKIIFSYRLIYRVDKEKVEIVTVIHCRCKKSQVLKRIK